MVLVAEEKAIELGLTPMAKIGSQASAAKKPEWFTTAPADAIQNFIEHCVKLSIRKVLSLSLIESSSGWIYGRLIRL